MCTDTGTTHTYVDPAVAAALYALIPGATSTTATGKASTYYLPCNTVLSQLPSFKVSMGDVGYVTLTAAILPYTSSTGSTLSVLTLEGGARY
jgi:hypothetical protein